MLVFDTVSMRRHWPREDPGGFFCFFFGGRQPVVIFRFSLLAGIGTIHSSYTFGGRVDKGYTISRLGVKRYSHGFLGGHDPKDPPLQETLTMWHCLPRSCSMQSLTLISLSTRS